MDPRDQATAAELKELLDLAFSQTKSAKRAAWRLFTLGALRLVDLGVDETTLADRLFTTLRDRDDL